MNKPTTPAASPAANLPPSCPGAPEQDLVWTPGLVQDAITNATVSLLGSPVVRLEATTTEVRAAVTRALAAAGITAGAIR